MCKASGEQQGGLSDDFVFRLFGESAGMLIERLVVFLTQENRHGVMERIERFRREFERLQIAFEPGGVSGIDAALDVAANAMA